MSRKNINHVLAVYVPWLLGCVVVFIVAGSGYQGLFEVLF